MDSHYRPLYGSRLEAAIGEITPGVFVGADIIGGIQRIQSIIQDSSAARNVEVDYEHELPDCRAEARVALSFPEYRLAGYALGIALLGFACVEAQKMGFGNPASLGLIVANVGVNVLRCKERLQEMKDTIESLNLGI